MAVENKYTHANFEASTSRLNKLLPMIFSGAPVMAMFSTVEIAAADSDTSVYRMFKGLNPDIIPLGILIGTDGITGGTVYDVGLFPPDLGLVAAAADGDVDCLASNLDLSSAADLGFATALDGMDAVAIENYGKKLYEHAGHTVITKLREYDLCLTGDTVGTGAGTVSVLMIYAQG